MDGSYTGENFVSRINDLIGATVEVVKRDELHTFVVCCQNDGSSNDHSLGSRSADGCGRIVRGSSRRAVPW